MSKIVVQKANRIIKQLNITIAIAPARVSEIENQFSVKNLQQFQILQLVKVYVGIKLKVHYVVVFIVHHL